MSKWALVFAALLAAAAVLAPGVQASFPGKSGSIAFDSQSAIYAAGASGQAAQRLASGVDPAYSPDGRQIAFTDRGGRKLMVMNSDGSEPRVVYESPSIGEPCFSADGTRIFFSRDTSGKGYADVYSISTAGGEPRRLTTTGSAPGSEADSHEVLAAANGRFLVFQRSDSIWTMRPDGSAQKRLASRAAGVSISPDGKRVVFARGSRLVMVGVGGGRERSISPFGSKPPPDGLSRAAAWPAFSPDGRAIAFTFKRTTSSGPRIDSSTRLAVYSLATGKLRVLIGPSLVGAHPDWQPLP